MVPKVYREIRTDYESHSEHRVYLYVKKMAVVGVHEATDIE